MIDNTFLRKPLSRHSPAAPEVLLHLEAHSLQQDPEIRKHTHTQDQMLVEYPCWIINDHNPTKNQWVLMN